MSYEQPIKPSSVDTSVEQNEKTLRLCINLAFASEGLATLEFGQPRTPRSDEPTNEQLRELALRIYEARRTRNKIMDSDLFGEPAWDMLLALYCLPDRDRLTVSGLSLAAEIAPTTGLRWQIGMIERGLLDKILDASDERLRIIRLTEKGRNLLELYLTQLFQCGKYATS